MVPYDVLDIVEFLIPNVNTMNKFLKPSKPKIFKPYNPLFIEWDEFFNWKDILFWKIVNSKWLHRNSTAGPSNNKYVHGYINILTFGKQKRLSKFIAF